jgi:hypothetical protein
MELIRLVVAGVTGVLLAGGYLASVSAYFSQGAPGYAARISESPVPILALILLLATVALAFVPNKETLEREEEAS